MKRLALLLGVSLVFACGDNSSNNNDTPVCGDGIKASTEQCDDGNTTNGDGCSSSCTKETITPVCGDGMIDPATEQCDDGNTTNGDGCSSTCQHEAPQPVCGDGMIEGSEACDDGNTTAADGCSQACVVEMGYMCTGEPSHCTVIPPNATGTCAAPFMIALSGTTTLTGMGTGDTSATGTMDNVPLAHCDTFATDDRAKDHIWTFTTTDVRDVTITLTATGTSDDTVLRLTTVPCDLSTSVLAAPSDDGCADGLNAAQGEVMKQSALQPGTYYIVVDGYDVDDVGPYTLAISAVASTCGNGTRDAIENCDDHNTTNGDGCSVRCQAEPGWTCNTASPTVCTHTCGNGTIGTGETCDDGNSTAGDGCDASCHIETGYVCTGTPSVCHATVCGDGTKEGSEGCDDHNTTAGDGCSATCTVEIGWTCTGSAPTTCTHTCGNGVIGTGETCDDGNSTAGDGCDASCHIETGYVCSGTPSVCHAVVCGDGIKDTGEGCDDHNTTAGDGCSATCTVETGWTCTGTMPSVCTHTCGNGTIQTGETCDDGNSTAGDGCDAACHTETGYACTGTPSTCHAIVCGDGLIDSPEACDDHGTTAGDGCSATCTVESGWVCTGTPSVCTHPCGNGVLNAGEACDDGNNTAGDGCSAACAVETSYACTGTPSTCVNTGGTCAAPYTLTLTASGTQYFGVGASDDTNSTDQVTAGMCESEASAGSGKDHQWKLVNPVAQPVKITLVGAQTPFDGIVRLMTTACDKTTQVHDDDTGGVSDGCSDLHIGGTDEVLTYNNLPAGTYYIDIDGYSSQGKYQFTVNAGSNCGNGIVEGIEECDAGGTTSTRCSATCALLFDTAEAEPNDTATTAQVVTPVSHIIKGSLPVGDLDVYKFTLTAPALVEVETYTTYASGYASTSVSTIPHLSCPAADTLAGIFDTTGDVTDDDTVLFGDDDDGDGHCSYIGPLEDATYTSLPAGTYYLTVHEYQSDNAIGRYMLDFKVTP